MLVARKRPRSETLKRLYFSYGSNMSARQMQRRCPGARALGAGRLAGWRFNITKRGTASIVPDPRSEVHGVIWRVTPEHLHTLDLYEGVPAGNYVRRPVEVATSAGSRHRVLTYVATRHLSGPARVVYMETAGASGRARFRTTRNLHCIPGRLAARISDR